MLKFVLLFPLMFVVTLFNYAFCWLIALFVDDEWHLPKWLKWFETTDALMNGKGILPGGGGGDSSFYQRHLNDSRWWTATCWLCRNPINGLDETILGARCPNPSAMNCLGQFDMDALVIGGGDRFIWRIITCGNKSWWFEPFEVYCKCRHTKSRYFRLRMGWKLEPFYSGRVVDEKAQYVFAPTLAKKLK